MSHAVRTLILTGGHDFEREAFFEMFDALPEVAWREIQHPGAHQAWEEGEAKACDAVVLYDFWQEISREHQEALVHGVGEEGRGLVVLHHAIANYQAWPEYARLIGARYFLAPGTAPDGLSYPRSQYHHDIHMRVRIADRGHPATAGLDDFDIVDEAYRHYWVSPDVHPLLTTAHPLSEPIIGWAHRYRRARVVYLQLGHDRQAYASPHYRRLVHQALRWTARRQAVPSAAPAE